MQIYLKAGLAFVAVPKTGSTAVHKTLSHDTDIVLRGTLKHFTAAAYRRRIAPFINNAFGVEAELFAVMRDPMDSLGSRFRYRSSEIFDGRPRSTKGLTFTQFAEGFVSDTPPKWAASESQLSFITKKRKAIMVDHLFSYNSLDKLEAFLSERFEKKISLRTTNVSPKHDMALSEELEGKMREKIVRDYEIFDRLTQAGGYIHTTTFPDLG